MPHTSTTISCSSGRQESLRRWCWILLMLAAVTVAGPMAAEKGKPLSVKDVSELLNGGVPSSEIARVVGQNGISFHMFDELESQFRQAGATDELIDALKRASKPEAPPPPTAGTLKVKSQPGEAQVYVDDEPRGVTSPGGELRLPGMAPGTYRLRVVLGGYKTWENSITITAGETEPAFVILEKQNLTPTVTLDADRSSIEAGQSVYLRWTSVNATHLDIEPGVGKVALAGSTSVSPRESTTYTLTAIGPGGIKTATTYVGVTTPPRPPPPPVVRPVVGNLPNFPVPGTNFQELKFFESNYNPPALGSRAYSTQFDHRTCRYINWELHLSFPPPSTRYDFTINATFYYANGTVFGNQNVASFVNPGWPGLVSNSGRGWQRAGMWKRGTYRVELVVNGSRIASGYFTIY